MSARRSVPEGENRSVLRSVFGHVRPAVFVPASVIIIGLIVFAVVYSAGAAGAFGALNSAITDTIGWWYILVTTAFVVFAIYCAISRIGSIKLGSNQERPEFSFIAWMAMLFSAGMGIGLVFYGVAEPLTHYVNPPAALGNPGGTDEAAHQAMELTLFHWGLHAWAIYVVVGLGMAYMTYRRGRPLSVRWLLEPLIGKERVQGWIGHTVDVVAVVGTLFGVATSLGFGITQIAAGLEFLGWIQVNNWWIVGIIGVITAIATASVVSGVSRGLKWLSNLNMSLAAVLALFVLLLGPTLFLLQAWVQNLGNYVQALPELALRTAPFTDGSWMGGWTVFYWGWWISWAPFVGMFIARISRGRTIREFVAGVLLLPTLIGSLWFTVFGDSAILRQRDDGDMLVDGAVDTNTSLFELLHGFPLGVITSLVAIFVIVFFFITSSDSGSLVIDILSTGGEDLDPPKATRVYWAGLEGLAAAVLLVVGGAGSLTALQTASIATAAPFSLVMVAACVAMYRAFRYDLATTTQFLQVSATDQSGAPQLRPDVSATLGGLVAVRSITPDSFEIHPDTGALTISAPVDPLRGDEPVEGDHVSHGEYEPDEPTS